MVEGLLRNGSACRQGAEALAPWPKNSQGMVALASLRAICSTLTSGSTITSAGLKPLVSFQLTVWPGPTVTV